MKQLSLLEQARLRAPETEDPEHVAQLALGVIRDLAEAPPIDLAVIADYCGIHEIRLEEMDHSGSLTPQGNRFVMRLRRNEPWTRRRFTGFHEVGHTFLPGYTYRAVFRCGPTHRAPGRQRTYSTEALADIAASEFLLPRHFVAADLAAGAFGVETVEALAQRYDAGIHASANRFVQLWPEPALLVILEPSNKPKDPSGAELRLRVQASWAQPFESWPWIPKWKSACDEGALARAFAGELVAGSASLDELDLEDPAPLEISARPFVYRANGELHQRVFALYRRRSHRALVRKGLHA